MSESKNNTNWEKLFDKYDILTKIGNEGKYFINANEINEFREARLMTKFDHKSQLPSLFADNDLSILPITRGKYLIAPFETFHHFEKTVSKSIIKVDFPNYLQSLDHKNITSESTAINCAFVCDILEDFIEDEELKPTVNGRMSSDSFAFDINTKTGLLNVAVSNSQIEIDGGYEGLSTLSLIEAKNYISNDFLVRQLFYPFKLWETKISKKIKPVFLTYTNGIFHLREYLFDKTDHYNSIQLIKENRYIIREAPITAEIIHKILSNIKVVEEPNLPFPQADSFERIINLCELLEEKSTLSKEEITQNYDFDERQTNYYTDAGRYLGIIEKTKIDDQIIYCLTKRGVDLFKFTIAERQLEFVKLILSHKVFNFALDLYFKHYESPSKEAIVDLMKNSGLYKVESESTFYRRSSTISSWINWIMGLIE